MKAPDALDRMLAGEPVETPEDVRELAALASMLQAAWQGEPTPAAVTKGKTAALEAFADAPAAAPSIVRVRPSRPRRIFARVALAAALVGVGLPSVAWAASENALPGEVMYPVKRAFEEVQIAFAGNPADEAAVLLEIAEERLREAAIAESRSLEDVIQQALAGFRDALARFDDRILAAQALGLSVDGLVERSVELSTSYQQILDALRKVPPNPTVSPGETADNDAPGKAKGKGKGKAKGHGKGKPGKREGAGAGQPQPARGTTPAGGGGGRDRGDRDRDRREERDDRQEEAPAAEDAEAAGHDDPGEGKGLGHDKGKGKGHEKHDD